MRRLQLCDEQLRARQSDLSGQETGTFLAETVHQALADDASLTHN